jgi:hypothetical protein
VRAGDGGVFVNQLAGVTLTAAWTSATETGWVGGSTAQGAYVARRAPGTNTWTPLPFFSARPLTTLYGFDTDAGQRLWVAGDGGMILRYEGP